MYLHPNVTEAVNSLVLIRVIFPLAAAMLVGVALYLRGRIAR